MFSLRLTLLAVLIVLQTVASDNYQAAQDPKNLNEGKGGFDCSKHTNSIPTSQCNEVQQRECKLFLQQGGVACENLGFPQACIEKPDAKEKPCDTCAVLNGFGGGRCYDFCGTPVCKSRAYIERNL